ncbi:DUF2345 domain-containing protein, partial [Pseudomonas aeruginosa]|nr:DUF2345 domain-containing protein [Pseudomonas aeruginosa]
LLMQAQHNSARLEAEQSVEMTASQGHMQWAAGKRITLMCGGAYIEMQGGDIEMGMPGLFIVKAASHNFNGSQSMNVRLPRWGRRQDTNWIEINHRDADDQPFVGQGYRIFFEGGQELAGVLDEQGHARHDDVPPTAIRVEYESRQPQEDPAWEPLKRLIDAAREKLG